MSEGPILASLGELRTFADLQRWSEVAWAGSDKENMRSPGNLENQLVLSAAECVPQDETEQWYAHVFLRIPSQKKSFGGFPRIRVVKATFTWPERELVFILEE